MRETREVRTRFSGDKEAAQQNVGHARVLLGKLKGDMQKQGLPQMQRSYHLEDGTQISVRSAFGQDTIDIHVPPVGTTGSTPTNSLPSTPPILEVPPPPGTMEPGFSQEQPRFASSSKIPPPQTVDPIPGEEAPPHEDRVEDKIIEFPLEDEEKKDPHPYLWIGARIAFERAPDTWAWESELIVAVWEPFDKTNNKPRGIVSTSPIPDFRPPHGGLSYGVPYAWADVNPVPEQVRPLFWLAPGVAEFSDGRALVQTTQHGLYLTTYEPYDWQMYTNFVTTQVNPIGYPTPENIGVLLPDVPYDPLAEVDDWKKRDMTPYTFGSNEHWPLWNTVVVLDPSPWLPPSDLRVDSADLSILGIAEMGEYLDVTPIAIGGKYAVKVGCSSSCWPQNPIPIPVDIEVRVGKFPGMLVKKFEVVIPAASNQDRTRYPYGVNVPSDFSEDFSLCGYESGGNPHYNWWQGAILANPILGTIEKKEFYVPEHGFAPASWNYMRDTCGIQAPVLIFVCAVYPQSSSWMATLPDAFALSIVNWGNSNPWQSPQTLPASSSDPEIQQAIYIKSLAAGVTDGVVYQWGSQPVGPTPVGAFTPVSGVVPDPTLSAASDPWISQLIDIATAGGYSYAVIMLVGVISVQYVALAGDGCAF